MATSRLLPAIRRVPLGWRMLSRERTRFLVTVAGVGFAVVLMFFLTAVHRGVETESNAYVSGRPVHAWLAQSTTTNLVRSSSFLMRPTAEELARVEGVESVSPLLKLIATLSVRGRELTAFVCGVDPTAVATLPTLVAGPGTLGEGEIIVDRALARRVGLSVGDELTIQGKPYRISGISSGTNVVISQFTFVNLRDAEELIGIKGVTSFYLVRGLPGIEQRALAERLKKAAPMLNVFTGAEFTRNNLAEMQTGLLPVLATVALFGTVVGAALLTLMLYSAILERREDYALLKAIGASRGFLRTLVLRQSLATVLCGLVFGAAGYAAAVPVISLLVPMIALSLRWPDVALITGGVLAMGTVGAWLPLGKLERIFPAEVFRA